MSASLPLLILNNTVTDSPVIFGVKLKSSIHTTPVLVVVSLVVLLVTIIGLLCHKQRCWRVLIEDSTQSHDEQPLHGISEQKKQRILAEAEVKAKEFKLRQELLVENRALKTQVYQQKKEFSKLSDDKQKCDESMEQINDKVTKINEQNYALILELSQLDYSLDLEHKRLNETQMTLNETQTTLEETERELYETQRRLQETATLLEQEHKLRLDLIEDFKQLQNKLKDEQNQRRVMVASLQKELTRCKEELEQAKLSHDAAMREKQREKRILHGQIEEYNKRQKELEERLKGEKQKYDAEIKVRQDRLNACIDENKGYKKALELISIEKASLMAEHKQLLGKFEAALEELDMYTERLKPDRCPNPGQCLACKAGLEGRCTIKNVAYELKCALCSTWSHTGETKRPIRERIQEHGRAAQHRDVQNPVGRHYANRHSGPQMPAIPFMVNITGRAVGNTDR